MHTRTEIRCAECGKLLGKFYGEGEMKCRYCKAITEFNTETKTVRLLRKTSTLKK